MVVTCSTQGASKAGGAADLYSDNSRQDSDNTLRGPRSDVRDKRGGLWGRVKILGETEAEEEEEGRGRENALYLRIEEDRCWIDRKVTHRRRVPLRGRMAPKLADDMPLERLDSLCLVFRHLER